MGSKLSSLLVQEGLVPVKKLEDALALQAILGGQLDTILLEKNLIDEATLVAAASRVTGIPPAQPRLFEQVSPVGAELVELAVARRLGVCPLAADSSNLTLLVSETTDPFALDDLAFQLDRTLHPHVTVELRVLQTQARVYDVPLDSRFSKLLEAHPDIPTVEEMPPSIGVPPGGDKQDAEPESGDSPATEPTPVTILEPLSSTREAEEPAGEDKPPEAEDGAGEPPAPEDEPPAPEDEPAAEDEPPAADDEPPAADDEPSPAEDDLSPFEEHDTEPHRPVHETALPKVMLHPDLEEATRALEPPTADVMAEMPPIPDDADDGETPPDLQRIDVLPEQELVPEEPPPPPEDDADDDEVEAEEPTDPGRPAPGMTSWDETTDPSAPPPLVAQLEGQEIVEETTGQSEPAPDDFAEDTDPESRLGIRVPEELVMEAEPPPPIGGEATPAATSPDEPPEAPAQPRSLDEAIDLKEPPDISEWPADEPLRLDARHRKERAVTRELPPSAHDTAPTQEMRPIRAAVPQKVSPLEQDRPDRLEDEVGTIRTAASRDDLLLAVSHGLARFVDGVKLYVVKRNLLVGHLEVDVDGTVRREIRDQPPLSLDIPTVLARSVDSGTLYLGMPPDTDASVSVLAAAGLLHPRGLALLPLVIRTKTVCLFVGWTRERQIPSADRTPLTRLMREAALGMAELIVRLKRKPAPAETATEAGPRVISDIGSTPRPSDEPPDLITLLHHLDQGGAVADEAERAVHALGKDAVQALISWFPGRVTSTRLGLDVDLPPVKECSAVMRALVAVGRPVLSAIAPLLLHPDPEVRFYATYLTEELVYPEAVALLARQLSDPDPVVRRLAVRVLRHFRRATDFTALVADLRTDLTNPDSRPRRGAIEGLGALGDEQAVPALLPQLLDSDPTIVQTVRAALINITKQDFKGNIEQWQTWWDQHRGRDRVQWLFDGLTHEDPVIRASSIAELEEQTAKTFGYSFDMPRREREAIRRRFIEWWSLKK